MTEEKQEYWSVDELVELTDKVQEREVEFREKLVKKYSIATNLRNGL